MQNKLQEDRQQEARIEEEQRRQREQEEQRNKEKEEKEKKELEDRQKKELEEQQRRIQEEQQREALDEQRRIEKEKEQSKQVPVDTELIKEWNQFDSIINSAEAPKDSILQSLRFLKEPAAHSQYRTVKKLFRIRPTLLIFK